MWQRVIAYFMKQKCVHCGEKLKEDAIKPLSEVSKGYIVRIHCTNCDKSGGTALVNLGKKK